MNEYLDSSDEGISQSHLLRMLGLGCFNVFFALPINVTSDVIFIISQDSLQFYQGWTAIHSDWKPILFPKSLWSAEKWNSFTVHWDEWINPFTALMFFALFGLTPEARKGYRRFFRFFGRLLGAKLTGDMEDELPEVVFRSGRGTNVTIPSNISS